MQRNPEHENHLVLVLECRKEPRFWKPWTVVRIELQEPTKENPEPGSVLKILGRAWTSRQARNLGLRVSLEQIKTDRQRAASERLGG